jgi:hypothetical protein
VTAPHSLFDSAELARWRASSRPAEREASPRVTIVCGCGVDMEVTWARASTVHCFGCGRTFAPPPSVTGAPFVWKPELAPEPAELRRLEPLGELVIPRRLGLARVAAPLAAALVALLVFLGARARASAGPPARAEQVPLQAKETSDDR